jgi:metallo-beta-lactamase family protein
MGEEELKLGFYGGVGKVTGANFLIENSDKKILIDCGLIQGHFREDEDPNYSPFPYNPTDINFLIITHAHMDHIGRIGKLVKDGFNGTIYSTHPTKDLAVFMLEDALKIMQTESKPSLYNREDLDKTFSIWKTIDYHENVDLGSFDLFLKDAGHILGSAIVELTGQKSKTLNVSNEASGKIKIVFTGDLGNSPTPLLKDTEKITDANYLITESVYGDRVHEEREERKEKLKQFINKVIKRGGTLIMPVFSLEKTQILLKELNDLIEDGEVSSVPVFFDSPLGIKLTSVYSHFTNYFNQSVQDEIKAGDDIFDFPKLKMTMRQSESREIFNHVGPKIIVASSGMSEGGRITAHEKAFLPDKKNGLLLIGYQVAGSVGRQIQDGVKKLILDDEEINIRAEIGTIRGYSSHKDSDHILEFIADSEKTLKKVFVVMGEPKASLFLAQKIKDNLDIDAVMPELGEEMII